jgi:XTP/dITP diphosphohydrolase
VATLLVATTNPGKLVEILPIFEELPLELLTLADHALFAGTSDTTLIPPDETGRSFDQNARLKALYYAQATGLLTVAEDSGLEIDALGGAPGVESSRFGGVNLPYDRKFALIYDRLRAQGLTTSPARFVCALAVAEGDRIVFEAHGTIAGQIAPEPKGSGGFGYDPIFFYPPFGCTLAEASQRKSTVSHRGEAFRKLRTYLLQTT